MKRPLLQLQFFSDGNSIFASHKNQHDLYDLLEVQPVLSGTVEQVSEKLEAEIDRVEVEYVETVRVGGKIYLIELLEDEAWGIIARCPEMLGISVRGKDQASTLTAIKKQIKAASVQLAK